ncbi:MAG TPA: zf-HC2 domain-containing protein [Gemmatimonadota bacterium]|nr:zf-HC2 domain-containing protein [Gemmatimonadota bacterium]
MNRSHLSEERLNDYAEGALAPADRQAVEDHLAACADCRAEAAGLRTLLADLERLPREVHPPRDLLPQIETAARRPEVVPIDREGSRDRAGSRGRSLRDLRAPLAAAALGLVVVTAAATFLFVQSRGPEPIAERAPGVAGSPAPGDFPAGFRAVANEYDRAIGELTATLESHSADLDPLTVRLVEENLRIIDRAIRESRAALDADPGNELLRHLVVASYERKLDLLRQATQPPAPL